jgi:hypothetical protein
MPRWQEFRREEIDGFTVIMEERMDRRNRQGATEYIVRVEQNGRFVLSDRYDWNVWLGHCGGKLLMPKILERAKTVLQVKDGFAAVAMEDDGPGQPITPAP